VDYIRETATEMVHRNFVIVLVLVVDGKASFSAVGTHILPVLVKPILEHIQRCCVDDILWQAIPVVDYSK